MSVCGEIRADLVAVADEKYRRFNGSLIPTVDRERVIGVRVPDLKNLAKKYRNHPKIGEFLSNLPHFYHEENCLHGYIIAEIKDYELAEAAVEKFLPYVDNWATCDTLSPKAFAKNLAKTRENAVRRIKSERTYTVRFGINTVMRFFLGDNFDGELVESVAGVKSDEYYVNMMIAWFFATALAKNYDDVLPYLTERKLCVWVHNKTIRKAIESSRICDEHKEFLRSLTIRETKAL